MSPNVLEKVRVERGFIRVEELGAKEGEDEVAHDREAGDLRVGQREVHPSVAEDLPVAVGDVVKAGDEARVDRRLYYEVSIRPGLLYELEGPQNWCPLIYVSVILYVLYRVIDQL